MRTQRLSAAVALGVCIFATLMIGLPAAATQVVPLTFEETIRRAGAIVVGTVSAGESRWGDSSRRWMVTDYKLKIDDVLYDAAGTRNAGDVITLTYWGGTIDGETQRIAETRFPVAGESLIFMLRPDFSERIGFTPTVGFNQGLFVVDDAVVDADGRPLTLSTDGGILRARDVQSGTEIRRVDLTAFSAWMRANLSRIKATPPSPDQPPGTLPNSARLYAKTPADPQAVTSEAYVPPLEDPGVISVPAAPGVSSMLRRPTITTLSRAAERPSYVSEYSTFGRAYPPIVVNPFPSSFAPWSPEDQYQMSKWNYYADIFRVMPAKGTFAWPDGVFDLDGWISSATMASVYGSSWDSGAIAVAFSRFDNAGRIIESDIAFNPAYSYTLDDEWVYDGSFAEGFRLVMLHELGHMHGLNHNFTAMSVMNYFPSPFRAFSMPYMDDAEGIRANYPSSAISRTDLGVYLYYATGTQSVTDASYPFSVTAGNSLFVNYYHVENVGTNTISVPTIEWYLTTARNYGSPYYYLGSTTYPSLPRFNYFTPSTVGRTLTVPSSVPSGSYYLGAFIRDDGGASQSGFAFSNNFAFSRYSMFVSGATACSSFSITPSSANPNAAAGSQGVTITGSPSGCQGGSWSTSGNGSWITVSPGSGSGSGSATVSWSQNTSASSRSGNASIAGNTFTVNQAGAQPPVCTSFQINPSSVNPSAAAGSQGVTITGSPAGCQGGNWSASGNGSWITVSPSGGTGPGSTTVSWSQNTSTARSGNATIAGNSFAVNQGGAQAPVCTSFQISPTSVNVTSAASSQGVAITGAPAGCQGGGWSAFGNDLWNTVSPASGSGPGSVTVFWNQNNSASSRSGSATIAGNVFPIFQSGTGGGLRVRGDFNGDARADVFWRQPSNGETSIWFMNGANSLTTMRSTTVQSPWTPSVIGDFDGDSRADLWWRNTTTGETSAWLAWNGSAFATQVRSLTVSNAWVPMGGADFNGDGKTDLFWRNTSTGETSIWFMNGAALNHTALTTTVQMPWTPGPFGDFDGDGKGDVFWRNPSSGQTAIWLGWNGSGFNTQVLSLTVQAPWSPMAAGDLNGGGKDDLFWFNPSTGETSIWFMNGAAVSSAVRTTTVPTSWAPSQMGDYDGNGTSDVFWRNSATGETSLWLGWNGTAFTTQVRSLTAPTSWVPVASP